MMEQRGESIEVGFEVFPHTDNNSVKVLLIDDQAIIGEAVRRMLMAESQSESQSESPIEFYYCADPMQAIAQAEAIGPTVILQDLVMPNVDGLELLRQFRTHAQLQAVPLIMLSTKDEPAIKAQAFGLGANDYLIKLPDRVELVARIRYHSRAYQNLQARSDAVLAQKHAQELEQTLQELRQTQAQLVQSEKLSSLGQMVAGVAHEMSNPVNFVAGNIKFVQDYTENLIGLIQLYQQEYPQPSPVIAEYLEAIDLGYVVEDLTKVMASMKLGTERLRDVALSLRNFARSDEAEMQKLDLHEGIDGTLLILSHRFEGSLNRQIEVVKQYGDLPLVGCHPAQINQVFMNLINNAIDAIREMPVAERSESAKQIVIQTRVVDSHWVEVSIRDHGAGMSPEVKEKLFTPFFTTKPTGKGTGLGLSIVQHIIEKHQGSIRVESELGKGTEFVIRLAQNLMVQSIE